MNSEQKIKAAMLVREIAELAGMGIETAFVPLDAVSDEQRDFAAWVHVEALAGIWEVRIKEAHKSQKMAAALINAANKHTSAKWWLDRQSHIEGGFIDDLRQDINKEMSK